MSLADLMSTYEKVERKKQGLSEQRLADNVENLRELIRFYRWYPDLLIDLMVGPKGEFKFFPYQRQFLRAALRYNHVYMTYPRGYSKSFLSVMALMLKCILYPNSHVFVTTGGKEQAANITLAKLEQICTMIPAMNNEIDWSRGATKTGRDNIKYIFKNGSVLDILPATERSRGQRRTAGLMEECVLIDPDKLYEIIIPTMVVDRQLPGGGVAPDDEPVSKSQIFITTAGYKNTFAYDKLIEFVAEFMVEPEKTYIGGGTYIVPVTEGLQSKNFLEEQRMSDTFKEESFDREYRSRWGGSTEGAFFNIEQLQKHRILNLPENQAQKVGKGNYYVLGVDVGRIGCATEVCVFKVVPNVNSDAFKSLVNIYSFNAEHFEDQAINIKRLFNAYKARAVVVDGNGLGHGLVDFMTRAQIDPDTGETLPPFGVINDEDGTYKKSKVEGTLDGVMYIMKANIPLNTEMYTYAQVSIQNGRIKFLIDEKDAKVKLLDTKVGQNMKPEERNERLKPYVSTSMLFEQMCNLVQENEGFNVILKQSSRGIPKDKFSAFIYGLYYIKLEEAKKNKRGKRDMSKLTLFSPGVR